MSRPMLAVFLLTAGLAAVSTGARAQNAPLVHWHFMGGFSEPVAATRDYLQGGYLLGGGFSVTPPSSPFDARFDFSYSSHKASNYLLDLGQQATNTQIDNGTGSFWSGTGNLVYHVPLAYGVRAYGIGGIGIYHARVELTQYDPFGGGYYYCDPFSGFCEVTGADTLIASHGVTKFGWNAGVGVEFELPYRQAWFIEARYHRIATDKPVEYVPIAIGYRF
ncbi:MAG: hypothetical protein NVS1B6_15940 [Steroidobacteraceae bacterium]